MTQKTSTTLTTFAQLDPGEMFMTPALASQVVLMKVNDMTALDKDKQPYIVREDEQVLPLSPRKASVVVRAGPRDSVLPIPELAEDDDEVFSAPPALVDWPGLPRGLMYEPRLKELQYEFTRTPVDPSEYLLNPKKPFEPDLKGGDKRDEWARRFLPTLSDEDRALLDEAERERKTQTKGRGRLKKVREQITKLEEMLDQQGLDEKTQTKAQKRLQKLQEEMQQLNELYDEGLHTPSREIPPPSTVKYGKDLKMMVHDGNPQEGVQNVLRVLEAARPDEVSYWKDWYKYARDDIAALSKKYKLPEQVVSGLVAALSPNVPWEQNVHAAEQVIRGRGEKVIEYRKRLSDLAATQLLPRIFPDLYLKRETLGTFGYLNNIEKAQRILDTYRRTKKWDVEPGELHKLEWNVANPKSRAKAEKNFAKLLDKGYIGFRTKGPTNWQKTTQRMDSFDPSAGRVIMLPPLGDPDDAPKVTAFYKSIMMPEKMQNVVVLDGHAQNIFYGEPRPLAELKRSITEEKRLAMIDAYKEAAKLSGEVLARKGMKGKLTPQQVQAVTWSVWRAAIPKNRREDGDGGTGLPEKTAGLIVRALGNDRPLDIEIVGDDSHQNVVVRQVQHGILGLVKRPSQSRREAVDGGRSVVEQEIDDSLAQVTHAPSLRLTAADCQAIVKEAKSLGMRELQQLVDLPGSFGVLSAYKARAKGQNQQSHGDLMAELQRRGYSPGQIKPLRGQYFAPGGEMAAEQSILVTDMDFQDAIELGQKFGQESVIYKGPDGVLGLYYTDGSNRVQFAETPEGALAVGSEQALKVKPRDPKPQHQGPPAESELWSKGRSVSFEFPLNFSRQDTLYSGSRPVTREEAEAMLGQGKKPTPQLVEQPQQPAEQPTPSTLPTRGSRSAFFARPRRATS